MAMTPAATYTLQMADAKNQAFIDKVTGAVLKAATAIRNEAVPDPVTQAAAYALWQRRQGVVHAVASDPDGQGLKFARLCVSLISLATATDPGDYDTAVATVWNTVAGAL